MTKYLWSAVLLAACSVAAIWFFAGHRTHPLTVAERMKLRPPKAEPQVNNVKVTLPLQYPHHLSPLVLKDLKDHEFVEPQVPIDPPLVLDTLRFVEGPDLNPPPPRMPYADEEPEQPADWCTWMTNLPIWQQWGDMVQRFVSGMGWNVDDAGDVLPTSSWLLNPPQFFPPSPVFPLPREMKSMEDYVPKTVQPMAPAEDVEDPDLPDEAGTLEVGQVLGRVLQALSAFWPSCRSWGEESKMPAAEGQIQTREYRLIAPDQILPRANELRHKGRAIEYSPPTPPTDERPLQPMEPPAETEPEGQLDPSVLLFLNGMLQQILASPSILPSVTPVPEEPVPQEQNKADDDSEQPVSCQVEEEDPPAAKPSATRIQFAPVMQWCVPSGVLWSPLPCQYGPPVCEKKVTYSYQQVTKVLFELHQRVIVAFGEAKQVPCTVARTVRGAYVDDEGDSYLEDGPGRKFEEGALVKIERVETTCKLESGKSIGNGGAVESQPLHFWAADACPQESNSKDHQGDDAEGSRNPVWLQSIFRAFLNLITGQATSRELSRTEQLQGDASPLPQSEAAFALQRVSAQCVADILNDLYAGRYPVDGDVEHWVRATYSDTCNVVCVQAGNDADLKEIEELIEVVDSEYKLKVLNLKRARSDDVAKFVRSAVFDGPPVRAATSFADAKDLAGEPKFLSLMRQAGCLDDVRIKSEPTRNLLVVCAPDKVMNLIDEMVQALELPEDQLQPTTDVQTQKDELSPADVEQNAATWETRQKVADLSMKALQLIQDGDMAGAMAAYKEAGKLLPKAVEHLVATTLPPPPAASSQSQPSESVQAADFVNSFTPPARPASAHCPSECPPAPPSFCPPGETTRNVLYPFGEGTVVPPADTTNTARIDWWQQWNAPFEAGDVKAFAPTTVDGAYDESASPSSSPLWQFCGQLASWILPSNDSNMIRRAEPRERSVLTYSDPLRGSARQDNAEEAKLQQFWHDYYDALAGYYQSLAEINWAAFYKNHGYVINPGDPGATRYAPMFATAGVAGMPDNTRYFQPNVAWTPPPPYGYFPVQPGWPQGYYGYPRYQTYGGYGNYGYAMPSPAVCPPSVVATSYPQPNVALPAPAICSNRPQIADDAAGQFLNKQHEKLTEAMREYEEAMEQARAYHAAVEALHKEICGGSKEVDVAALRTATAQWLEAMQRREDAVARYNETLSAFGPLPGSSSNAAETHAPAAVGQRTQIKFTEPLGMKVVWYGSGCDVQPRWSPTPLEVPGRYNFVQGATYRLKIDNIEYYPLTEFYPTLEVLPATGKSQDFLAHSAVPLGFTRHDLQMVKDGNYLVKVIYLPDPEYQVDVGGGVAEIVSTLLDPGTDPVKEARKRGTVLAVVRIGDVQQELSHSPPLDGSGKSKQCDESMYSWPYTPFVEPWITSESWITPSTPSQPSQDLEWSNLPPPTPEKEQQPVESTPMPASSETPSASAEPNSEPAAPPPATTMQPDYHQQYPSCPYLNGQYCPYSHQYYPSMPAPAPEPLPVQTPTPEAQATPTAETPPAAKEEPSQEPSSTPATTMPPDYHQQYPSCPYLNGQYCPYSHQYYPSMPAPAPQPPPLPATTPETPQTPAAQPTPPAQQEANPMAAETSENPPAVKEEPSQEPNAMPPATSMPGDYHHEGCPYLNGHYCRPIQYQYAPAPEVQETQTRPLDPPTTDPLPPDDAPLRPAQFETTPGSASPPAEPAMPWIERARRFFLGILGAQPSLGSDLRADGSD